MEVLLQQYFGLEPLFGPRGSVYKADVRHFAGFPVASPTLRGGPVAAAG
jgi:hypothetical protein